MKNIVSIVIILLLIVSNYTYSQNKEKSDLEKKYDEQTIYFQIGFWTSYFIQNNKKFELGFLGRNLNNIISSNPKAVENMKKYKNLRITGFTFYFVGLAVMCLTIPVTLSYGYNETTFYAIYSGGAFLAFIGIFPIAYSVNYLHRAIWHYNRYILIEDKEDSRTSHNKFEINLNLFCFRFN